MHIVLSIFDNWQTSLFSSLKITFPFNRAKQTPEREESKGKKWSNLMPTTRPRAKAIAIGYQELIKSSPGSFPPGNIFNKLVELVEVAVTGKHTHHTHCTHYSENTHSREIQCPYSLIRKNNLSTVVSLKFSKLNLRWFLSYSRMHFRWYP